MQAAFRSLMREANASRLIEMLIKSKVKFQLRTSNYTMQIVLSTGKFNFIKEQQSNAAFAAFAKLKHDIADKKKPRVNPNDVRYFVHDFKEPLYVERVVNIDLKSAYATILKRDGFITDETFKYLQKINKRERLAAVGMLASRKEVYDFEGGEPGPMIEERSEFSPFFFHCVKRTAEIMGELKKICGKSYLFTWVDGIYFLPDPGIREQCEIYLRSINLKYSTEHLQEFDVKILERSIFVAFKKEGKTKTFDLPIQDSAFKRAMSNALLLANNKKQKR